MLRAASQDRAADRTQSAVLRALLHHPDRPIWVSGTRAARLLHYVPDDRAVVAHLPELDPGFDPRGTEAGEDERLWRERPDGWVIGSGRQRQSDERPAAVVPDVAFLPDAPARRGLSRNRLLRLLGLPPEVQLVGSLGEVDWWEVPDDFVRIAWQLLRRPNTTPTHLVWLAGSSTARELWPLRHDLAHAGIEDRVHILGDEGIHPLEALAAMDVVLLSRRGAVSWPQLRQIEGVGVPIVRWALPGDQTTGGSGQLARHTALVTPLDDRALVEAVSELLVDPVALASARHHAEAVRAAVGDKPGRPTVAGARPALCRRCQPPGGWARYQASILGLRVFHSASATSRAPSSSVWPSPRYTSWWSSREPAMSTVGASNLLRISW